jgi:AAA+ superfamily predicted ATPase
MSKPRPSFTNGHVLRGLPAIRRALFSNERVELFELGPKLTAEHQVLCLLRRASDLDRARSWFSHQPPEMLEPRRSLEPDECPSGTAGIALCMRGDWLGEQDSERRRRREPERLLRGMLELATHTRETQQFPDFNPGFSWVSESGSVCTLLPLVADGYAEPDLVREMARAFYRFATGIDPAALDGPLPKLSAWSQLASGELSQLMERCLSPKSSREAITSWAVLERSFFTGSAPRDKNKHDRPATAPQARSVATTELGLRKVAGMRELKALLEQEVIGPLRNPEPYLRYGVSIPNGILLYGPPGCGKTYIARQLAEELGHYFVEVIPSEVAGMYVHQTVIKIRELFEAAREHAPAVVFIDEFEALVPPREQLGGHQQHKAEEVNELLAQLSRCAEQGILLIAATNRPEKIDAAVRRTGRLDKLIYVGPPDRDARHDMLAMHLEGRPRASDCNLMALVDELVGYSASDLRCLVDEAARDAMRAEQPIGLETFRSAMARVRPSLTAAVEEQYRSIETRGVANGAKTRPSGIGFR